MMKLFSKKISLFFAALLVFVNVLQIPASASVPNRPWNQSVLDSAGVLSDEFEQEINRKNQQLFADTGAEIAVVAVDFLGGMAIDDYAYDLFISWGIGSQERNNGLLLVLAIAEDDYYAMPGYGIEDVFTGSHLHAMLDEYLEDDFAAGNYEWGVEKFFDAAYTELSNYTYNDDYGADYDTDYDTGYNGYAPHKESSGISLFSVLRVIFYIVVVVPLFILVIASIVVPLFCRHSDGQTTQYYDPTPQYRRRDNFWTGMFLGQALGRSQRRNRRNPPPPPPPPPGGFGGFNSPGPTNRPGGFSGGGAPQRPSSGFSSRPFSGGSSRPSGGGFSRPSSGSSRPSGGFSRGGGSRGGGAGRRK